MATLSAAAQAPLTVSLQSGNFNGYQVKCFGKQTGAINATITGGTTPYQYNWSNGATTEDLSALAAGYYKLTVTDADSTVAVADITLTEPTPLIVVAEPYTWPNGYNISCYECYNGSIDVTVGQGVPPYTYLWNDSLTTTQDRVNIGAKKHFVVVTDANNCWVKSENVILTQPERSVWDRAGNTGTDPATQYLGTADNKDVVLKTNGQERLRLKSNGEMQFWGADTVQGLLVRDSLGIVRPTMNAALRELLFPVANGPEPCTGGEGDGVPYWRVYGNDFEYLCDEDPLPYLGTLSNHDLSFRTNNVQRMVITSTGKVGIGTIPPGGPIDQYRLFVEDGIVTRDVLAKVGPWPDYVFKEGYHLLSFDEWRGFIRGHGHLPGMLSAAEVEKKGGIELADSHTRLLKVVEEQALYILQLEERVKALENPKH